MQQTVQIKYYGFTLDVTGDYEPATKSYIKSEQFYPGDAAEFEIESIRVINCPDAKLIDILNGHQIAYIVELCIEQLEG